MNKINNSLKDAFDHVTAEKELIQKTEDAVLRHVQKENKRQQSKKITKLRNRGIVLASVFIFAFAGLFVYREPVSAVSIDSDSSVEIYFNRFNHVIDVVSYDEQGNPQSEAVKVHNKSFQEVIDEILNDFDSDEVYITVASRHKETADQMISNLSHHQEMMNNMHIYQSSEEVMDQARQSGTSMGRMHAMHQLEEADANEPTEELMKNFEKHHQEMMHKNHKHHQDGHGHGGHMNRSR